MKKIPDGILLVGTGLLVVAAMFAWARCSDHLGLGRNADVGVWFGVFLVAFMFERFRRLLKLPSFWAFVIVCLGVHAALYVYVGVQNGLGRYWAVFLVEGLVMNWTATRLFAKAGDCASTGSSS